MSLRRPRRLHVESLESRITPAVSVKLYPGLLVIRGDNLPNNLVVAETATPGKFAVTNNAKAIGQFTFSNLSITMGNSHDDVTLQVKTALTGRLTVNLGNSYDTFSTIPSAGPAVARIGGDVLINTGLTSPRPGAPGVPSPDRYDEIIRLYNLRVGGNVTVIGSPGSGTGIEDNQNVRIGGLLSVVNVSTITMGNTADSTLFATAAGVSISNVQKNTDNKDQGLMNVPPGNGFYMYGGSQIFNNLSYTGGSGIDSVFLPSGPNNGAGVTIGGNVTANLGGGSTNTLQLGDVAFGADVGGNVQYTAGNGDDRLLFDSGSTVGGNLYVSLGEGSNQLFGDSLGLGQSQSKFNPFGSATVGGNMTVVLGNGNNFIGTYDATLGPASLSVGGNLTFLVGNGDNYGGDATVAVAPPPANLTNEIQFFNSFVTVGGTTTYRAGTGLNHLSLTGPLSLGQIRLLFSGGDTSLRFTNTGQIVGNTLIDYGTGFGPKDLIMDANSSFGPIFTLLNYP